MNKLLLSFDVEEFDLPLNISENEKFETSFEGLKKILVLLDRINVRATFFVTYVFAKRYNELIKKISKKHEISLHGYAHSDVYKTMNDDEIFNRLEEAKEGIEDIIGEKISGFRSQRLQKVSKKILFKLGLQYDSSLNPTWIPGRYNNFFCNRRNFDEEKIKIIPFSVTPILRFPFFWLTFRNLGVFLSLILSKLCLIGVGYTSLYLHPWEFVNLKPFKIPFFIKRNSGSRLIYDLEKFIVNGKFEVYRYDRFLTKYL